MTWKFIKQICDRCDEENVDIHKESISHRSDIISKKYSDWKQNAGENGLFDMLFNSDGNNIVIRKNDFPYNFEEGIIHYVVWIHPSQTVYNFTPRMDNILLSYVVKQLNNIHSDIKGIVHFRNSSDNRTINGIAHYHVIIKV